MLNNKFLLFASVIMATAGDKGTGTPQPDMVVTNYSNDKEDILFKIVNYRKTTIFQIDNLIKLSYQLVDNKNLDEKSKTQVCNELKRLATHFYDLFDKYIHHLNENCVCEFFPIGKLMYIFDIKHLDTIYNESMLKDPSDFHKIVDDIFEILETSTCRISHNIMDGFVVKNFSMDDVEEYHQTIENFIEQILLSINYLNTIG